MSVTDKNQPVEPSFPCGRKKRRFLSAEKKFQLFLETQRSETPVGEVLRREGLYSTDLARIQRMVKEGALERLAAWSYQYSSAVLGLVDGELEDERHGNPQQLDDECARHRTDQPGLPRRADAAELPEHDVDQQEVREQREEDAAEVDEQMRRAALDARTVPASGARAENRHDLPRRTHCTQPRVHGRVADQRDVSPAPRHRRR